MNRRHLVSDEGGTFSSAPGAYCHIHLLILIPITSLIPTETGQVRLLHRAACKRAVSHGLNCDS